MSLVAIQVQLPPQAQALVEKLDPVQFRQAVARGMTRALEIVKGRIVLKRLTGTGPFPPAENRLGQRTGQLARSVRAEPAVVKGDEVIGAIGSPVIYARVHEFGATIVPRTAKALVFAIGDKKVFAKKVTIPERAPFRTEIAANVPFIQEEIGKEVATLLQPG